MLKNSKTGAISLHTVKLALLLLGSILFTAYGYAGDGSSNHDNHNTNNNDKAPLSIADARITLPPPGVPMMAGYATLTNKTHAKLSVVALDSESFAKIEMHETTVKDEVARMRKQKELTVPAHASLEMKPGSYHLMLMEPVSELKEGDLVTVNITLASGETIVTEFPVMPLASMKKHDHKSTHKDEHKDMHKNP